MFCYSADMGVSGCDSIQATHVKTASGALYMKDLTSHTALQPNPNHLMSGREGECLFTTRASTSL